MHDRLFEHQQQLADEDLRAHAGELGLDVDRFERELLDHTHKARVDEDYASGAASGIPSTPRFFVNGRMHPGSATEPELRRVIEAERG